jgi:hypothetical protein
MHQNWLRNTLLTVVALLLGFTLRVKFSSPVHALSKTQYKVVSLYHQPFNGNDPQREAQELQFEQTVFDQQNAQGWEYAGNTGQELIFKK